MIEIADLPTLSDRDLGNFIRDVRLKIVACESRLESSATTRQRTVKLARGTFLTVGGFFEITLEPLAAVYSWLDFGTGSTPLRVMQRQ